MARTYVVKTTKDIKNISIRLLSDFHYYDGMDISFLEKQKNELISDPTDYVFVLGDIFNDSNATIEELKTIRDYFYELSKSKAKIVIIFGNHDYLTKRENNEEWKPCYNLEIADNFKNIDNLRVLQNESISDNNITISGSKLYGGYYEYSKENPEFYIDWMNKKFKEEISNKSFNIVLEHSPINAFKKEIVEKIPFLNTTDLILSGHNHNGLVPTYISRFLPGSIGLVDAQMHKFPKYTRGKVKINENTTGIIASPMTTFGGDKGLLQKMNIFFPPEEQTVLIKKI